MAVAADSHRSFLIPERYRYAVSPTTRKCGMNCVILLYLDIIAQNLTRVNGNSKKETVKPPLFII